MGFDSIRGDERDRLDPVDDRAFSATIDRLCSHVPVRCGILCSVLLVEDELVGAHPGRRFYFYWG